MASTPDPTYYAKLAADQLAEATGRKPMPTARDRVKTDRTNDGYGLEFNPNGTKGIRVIDMRPAPTVEPASSDEIVAMISDRVRNRGIGRPDKVQRNEFTIALQAQLDPKRTTLNNRDWALATQALAGNKETVALTNKSARNHPSTVNLVSTEAERQLALTNAIDGAMKDMHLNADKQLSGKARQAERRLWADQRAQAQAAYIRSLQTPSVVEFTAKGEAKTRTAEMYALRSVRSEGVNNATTSSAAYNVTATTKRTITEQQVLREEATQTQIAQKPVEQLTPEELAQTPGGKFAKDMNRVLTAFSLGVPAAAALAPVLTAAPALGLGLGIGLAATNPGSSAPSAP